MNAAEQLAVGSEVLYREARLLDLQRWDEWLAMYEEDCVFWVPAWDGEHRTTEDPQAEISLIYYADRAGLQDRVWRIRSGKSIASVPLVRTTHLVGNVELLRGDERELELCASWTVHVYRTKRKEQQVLFGRYEHTLRRADAGWRIARKKITLVNDTISTMVDVYCL